MAHSELELSKQGVREVGSELLLQSDDSFEYLLAYGATGYRTFRVALQAADQHFEAATTSDGAAVFPDVANALAVSFEVRVHEIKAGPFVQSFRRPEFRLDAEKSVAK